MPTLHLVCLGAFSATLDGQSPLMPLTLLTLRADKIRALLAYLALEPRPHRRETLAGMFWPELADDVALTNLRTTLHRLRQPIEQAASEISGVGSADALFRSDRQTVALAPGCFETDVQRFETLIDVCRTHPHKSVAECDACLARLAQAVALYQDELLTGLTVGDAAPFEEWLALRREGLHQKRLSALYALAIGHENRPGDEAQHYARQLLALEPWREDAHRLLMRILVRSGQTSSALAQYQSCRQQLATELGIEPDPETTALYEQIRAGKLDKVTGRQGDKAAEDQPVSPTHPHSHYDWGEMPAVDVFHGRSIEMLQLQVWLVQDRCRLVWVLGIGGVGKTSLAATAANEAVESFDVVFWRSLMNAPPIDEILRAAVQTLSRQRAVDFPPTLDEQLALLLDLLRQTRCLFVLDNFESIMQAGESSSYRPGYEAYDQLIRLLANNRHNSCLLITSRELPKETARLNGNVGVRTLRLMGLAPDAARAMLLTYDLDDDQADVNTLVQRYSGNPLALKLVAQTVTDLFQGSISEFLSVEAPIFDDVRTVLDSQFDRLSPLQREIMIWLAIAREGTILSALREDLLHPPAPREFLEALRTLQHRSLVEKASTNDGPGDAFGTPVGGAALTLQNVILEYVTARMIDAVCSEIETGHVDVLNRHVLLDVRAKEYVRQSQMRLIVQPIAERLMSRLGAIGIERQCHRLLATLHQSAPRTPGYAAGNILNVLVYLGFDTARYDFSRLCVWQADLRGVKSAALNLAESDVSRSAFTLVFNVWAIRMDNNYTVHIAGINARELCLWRVKDGQLRHAARSTRPLAAPVAFSADGRFVAHGSPDCVVYVCAADDGTVLRMFQGHAGNIIRIAFSRDGSLVASCGRDSTIHIWNVDTGQEVQVLREEADDVACLAFSPDAAILAGGGEHRTLSMWDVSTGQVIRTMRGHARELECCAFSPDGTMLASGSHDGEIRLWDAGSGAPLHAYMGHPHIVRALTFHPNGDVLASSAADGSVRLWRAHDMQLLRDLVGHKFETNSLAFSPDGRMLATGSLDESVRVWDSTTGYVLDVFNGYSYLSRALRFNPDPAAHQVVSADNVGNVHVWDLRTYTSKPLRGDALVVFGLAFSPDGRRMASGGADGVVHVWDASTGNRTHTLRGHTGTVKAVAFGAGGRVIASGGTDRTIRLWSMEQPDAVTVLRGHEDDVIGLAFDRQGHRLVSGSLDHIARVWDVRAGPSGPDFKADLCHVLRAGETALYSVAISPDGQRVVTNAWTAEICWWDANTGQQLPEAFLRLKGFGIAFSPDGNLIAVANGRCIEIRDAVTHDIRFQLHHQFGSNLVIDFDATSSLLTSCDAEGILYVWDVRTGACLHQLRLPGPYAGMNITGVTGISDAQRAALKALGAIG